MVAQEELGRTKGGGKRGNIVAHDVSLREQNAKHLLRTQNVSEQNQKHFLCPGHKKHLCRQQRVRKIVSSFARTLKPLFREGLRGSDNSVKLTF